MSAILQSAKFARRDGENTVSERFEAEAGAVAESKTLDRMKHGKLIQSLRAGRDLSSNSPGDSRASIYSLAAPSWSSLFLSKHLLDSNSVTGLRTGPGYLNRIAEGYD
jgi:hypothetical protein